MILSDTMSKIYSDNNYYHKIQKSLNVYDYWDITNKIKKKKIVSHMWNFVWVSNDNQRLESLFSVMSYILNCKRVMVLLSFVGCGFLSK